MLSRAKRGTTLIKKVKSTNYEIIKAFSTSTKDIIGIKSKDDIYLVKIVIFQSWTKNQLVQ